MAPVERRCLIVNADDFGASGGINSAVVEAHRRGILTTASLMVNGAAFQEAVELARRNPGLGVGLHLSLCCGRSTLTHSEIPALVDRHQNFGGSPVRTGIRYFFSAAARRQLEAEIEAQFERFASTGLEMDHLNGHLHFHLHPAVFQILKEKLIRWKVRAVRLSYDPPSIDLALGRSRWGYRLSHALIFKLLSNRARPFLRLHSIARSDYVFGLLEHSLVSKDYILRLLPRLPTGVSELYSHPAVAGPFQHEFEALVSPEVRKEIDRRNIQLIRYRDL